MTPEQEMPFASVLEALFSAEDLPIYLLYRLSDLSDAEFEQFKQEWRDVDEQRRIAVVLHMSEIIEEITRQARRSKYVDQASGVSARFSLANYRAMVASARQRSIVLNETPAVPRISDLGHLYSSSLGKLELDLMGSHQMSERQVLDSIIAEAIKTVFRQYVDQHGLDEIADVFAKGVRIEVGDMLPSSKYVERLQAVPPAWDKAFDVNAGENPAIRAACVEFVLAGLYSMDRISRSQKYGQIQYEF